MNIIKELFDNNEEYKSRLPKTFAGGFSLSGILDKLKEQFIKKQGFNDDTKQVPVINDNNEDIIVKEVDNKIPRCLDKLHDAHIKSNFMVKKILSVAETGMINAFAKGESYVFLGKEINFSNF